MESRLQSRIQRYGWDLAAAAYEENWRAQLHALRQVFLATARLFSGARILDVACGSGALSIEAASVVGASGFVTGIDISERMVSQAQHCARLQQVTNVHFLHMDAKQLQFESGSFDVVLCSLGLMYTPDITLVLSQMRRVLAPGGRIVFAVWGRREACGWAGIFDVVQAEVKSQVCPTFFQLGRHRAADEACTLASLRVVSTSRMVTALHYPSDRAACDAATLGGPVALAWSRFDAKTRTRVEQRYLDSLMPWRSATGFLVPAEFVIVLAVA